MILTMLYESQFIASVLMIIFILLAIVLQIFIIITLRKLLKEIDGYEQDNDEV